MSFCACHLNKSLKDLYQGLSKVNLCLFCLARSCQLCRPLSWTTFWISMISSTPLPTLKALEISWLDFGCDHREGRGGVGVGEWAGHELLVICIIIRILCHFIGLICWTPGPGSKWHPFLHIPCIISTMLWQSSIGFSTNSKAVVEC